MDAEERPLDATSTPIGWGATTACIHCKELVTGWFVYLPGPYYGLVHWKCRPWVTAENDWPHEHGADYYKHLDCNKNSDTV